MNSILSFKERGNYGKSSYRGNCSGYTIKQMLEFYRPQVYVDPTLGGGTSRDVVAELNRQGRTIEFYGLDLHSGFNLLKDSIADRIGGARADYVFCHPPYGEMIRYSGRNNVWGEGLPHPDDLSNCRDYSDFLAKMKVAMQNIYDSLASRGHYSILIGDIRKNGVYTSIQADLLQIAPGTLDGVMIKQQFNCVSDRKIYANQSFIPIMHEYLLNFKKELTVFGVLDTSLNISKKLTMLANANWKGTVHSAIVNLGGKAALAEIYDYVEKSAPEKTRTRPNYQARIRATLQDAKDYFRPVERGVWTLAGSTNH